MPCVHFLPTRWRGWAGTSRCRKISIDRALEILASGVSPADVVITHEFPLAGYRGAVRAGLDKVASRAVKVVFRPSPD